MGEKTAEVQIIARESEDYIRLLRNKIESEGSGEVVIEEEVVYTEGDNELEDVDTGQQQDEIDHIIEEVEDGVDPLRMEQGKEDRVTFASQFSCSLCDFETIDEDDIKNHMESHEICMLFSCKHCNFQAASKSSLRNHLTESHEDLCYKCKNCDYKSTTYGAMSRHVRTVHKGEKFACSMCKYVATQKSNLTTHMAGVHSNSAIKCKLCKEEFNSKTDLEIHEITHEKVKKDFIYCTYENCIYKARTKYGLQLHVEKVHLGRRYVCEECNYIATQKCHLRVHIRTVHEGRSFPCHLCDHVASYKNNLKRHVISIHGAAANQS